MLPWRFSSVCILTAPSVWRNQAQGIPFGLHGPQTGFDIAKTLPISKLREGHHPQMFAARKRFDLVIAAVATDARIEPAPRKELHQLREHQFACVHRPIPLRNLGNRKLSAKAISNQSRSCFSVT